MKIIDDRDVVDTCGDIIDINVCSEKFTKDEIKDIVEDYVRTKIKPQLKDNEYINPFLYVVGRLQNSGRTNITIKTNLTKDMSSDDVKTFKMWLSSEFNQAIFDKQNSENKPEPAEAEVVNGPQSALNGVGGLLGGLMGANIPDDIKNAINGFGDVIDPYKLDKEYYDKHVHYQILLEATESFDREFVKALGELTKLDGHAFDTGCRNCVTTLMSYFTINNHTNWPDLHIFIEDIKKSLAYELESNCGFRDDEKNRVAADHMKIVHQNLYDKLMIALDKIEFEININRGVLPAPEVKSE